MFDFIVDNTPKALVTVFAGQFEIRTTPDNASAQSRVNKAGKTIHFIPAKSVAGIITGVEVDNLEFGKVLQIHMNHKDEVFMVSLRMTGNPARGFLRCMENIDLTKPVRLDATEYERDGKKRQYLFVKQDGKNVPAKYTKDAPGDKPDWKLVKVDGNDIWDKSEETAFFEKVIEERIRPVLTSAATRLMAVEDGNIITGEDAPVEDEDDLPW